MDDELKMMEPEVETEPTAVMDKVRSFVRMNLTNAGILIICLLFVATAVLRPEKTDLTLEEVILGSLLAFITSMGINYLFTSKALGDGMLKPDVVEAKKAYSTEVEAILDDNQIEALDNYCKEQNEKNYKKQRMRILSAAGLLYEDCFDDKGAPKEIEITVPAWKSMRGVNWRIKINRRWRARKQIKAYSEACTLRLAEISAGELMGEDSNSRNPYKFGRKVKVFRGQSVSTDAASKSLTGIGLGLYTAAMIADFSWIKLASMVFQVVFFIAMGIVKYLSTVTYVTEEYHGRIVGLTREIKKFRKGAERTNDNEVPRKLGNPDNESTGESPTDRELHAAAGSDL